MEVAGRIKYLFIYLHIYKQTFLVLHTYRTYSYLVDTILEFSKRILDHLKEIVSKYGHFKIQRSFHL